jgi:hypothetical protein
MVVGVSLEAQIQDHVLKEHAEGGSRAQLRGDERQAPDFMFQLPVSKPERLNG